MSDIVIPKFQTVEEFNNWLKQSEHNQEWFLEQIPETLRAKLDRSVESMQWLGTWLCERYPTLESVNQEVDKRILDGVGYYVGETFIKHFGGKWTIKFEPPNMAYLGYPCISNYETGFNINIPKTIHPHTLVTAAIDRNDSKYILDNFLRLAEVMGGE